MNHTITTRLLARLEDLRTDISLNEEEGEKTAIFNACREVAAAYDERIAANTMNIINHYLSSADIGIDDMIMFLTINSHLDLETHRREEKDGFDKEFGTVTSLILTQYELPETVSLQRFQDSNRCHPSPLTTVQMALTSLAKYGICYEEFVFIDVGAGLGRNLLLAAGHPFRKIIGIELSAYLCERIRQNIAVYRERQGLADIFEVQCINALIYPLPEENIVFYMWRPFSEEIATDFITKVDRFIQDTGRKVIFIVLGPVYAAFIHSSSLGIVEAFPTTDRDGNGEPFLISVFSSAVS